MTKCTWEVWTEGYRVTGNKATAMFHGNYPGETFEEAVKKCVQEQEMGDCFNEEHLTYWGCRFYDNGTDARRTFG